MNVVSYSLYGPHAKYCTGAIRNAQLVRELYPDWQCWIYHDKSVPPETLDRLKQEGAILHDMSGHRIVNGMFWRFMVNDEKDVVRYLIRDADSRIIQRDVNAVADWIDSGLPFHIMRDHPHHTFAIPGGAWGGVPGVINIEKLLLDETEHLNPVVYGADQRFLQRLVFPEIIKKALVHDSCYHRQTGGEPFPDPINFEDFRFVGEAYDENDNPRPYDWEMRMNYV